VIDADRVVAERLIDAVQRVADRRTGQMMEAERLCNVDRAVLDADRFAVSSVLVP